MGPFLFSGLRMYLASLSLVVIIFVNSLLKRPLGETQTAIEKKTEKDNLIKGGVLCGVIIFLAANFQQVGLVSVSAGKAGFITTLYIVLVPLFGIFLKHKTTIALWIGVVLATAGLYFLCITEDFTISFGDFVVLIGAFFWAFHILAVDYFAPKVEVTKLMCLQFLIAGTLSLAVALFKEMGTFSLESLQTGLPTLLYAGILSGGLAFTFQGMGQKHANPTVTSIILSTESLFAAIFGFLLLQEVLSNKELLGCVLMFAAVMITQLPSSKAGK